MTSGGPGTQLAVATSSQLNSPIGRVDSISEPIRVEDFEAMRRAYDKEQAMKRKKQQNSHSPSTDKKRKTAEERDPSNIHAFRGPWASASTVVEPAKPTETEIHASQAVKEVQVTKFAEQVVIKSGEEKTIFHGAALRDYLGRTYISPPHDLDIRLDKEPGSFECFAPKRLVHTWVGHTKGVTAIRFFPGTGHLLLSASQDMRVKIWDVQRDRQCQRTFLGHNKPVRDINFDPTGIRFISAGYDKALKYWDTETGQCLLAIDHTAIPFCAKFHPSQPHILLAGCSDRRIMQWDMRSGEIVQEYNQHQEAVNTITFFDEGRRFVSTGDDKAVRVWDFDVPVSVKSLAEPDMQSMPAAALHPDGENIIFQSLDNRLITYTCAGDKFAQRGRKFGGHSTAGYACQPCFSPDGKYLVSGSGNGQMIVWEWRTGQIVRRIEAHTKVCIDVQWNPQESSRVATCSWDGTIKYWD